MLKILAQVAEALGEAHALGIVHRDMKPENIMVESREGEDVVKVLDFGIAKIAEPTGRPALALTAVGQTLGTLEFMSPEQLRGQPLDGRSDIYALGILAYEMLTGRLPFDEARGPSDIIQFHMQADPPAALQPAARAAHPARGGRGGAEDGGQDRATTATPTPPSCASTSTRPCWPWPAARAAKATLKVVAVVAGGLAALLATLLLLAGRLIRAALTRPARRSGPSGWRRTTPWPPTPRRRRWWGRATTRRSAPGP